MGAGLKIFNRLLYTFYVYVIFIKRMPTEPLKLPDVEFWRMISDATFANPFSDQRYELDRQIAGYFEGERERAELLKNAVCARVERLQHDRRANLRHWEGDEREVM